MSTQQTGPEPDLAAERGVLAAICRHGTNAWMDACDILRVNSFTLDSNQVLWRCLEHVLAEGEILPSVDIPTIYSAARSLNLAEFLSQPDEKRHLQAVLRYPVDIDGVRRLAQRVRRLDVARDLALKLEEARNAILSVTGDESIDQLIALAESPVFALTSDLSRGPDRAGSVRLGLGAVEYFQNKLDNPRESIGIPTGLARFDRAIGGGLRPACIDFIVARQKTGKSILAVNIALFIAGVLGIPVLYVDTEINREAQLDRAAACLSGVWSNDIELGRVSPEMRPRLMDAARRLQEMPLEHEYIKGLGTADILTRLRRWVMRSVGTDEFGRTKPCVIIYDWLKLMDSSALSRNMAEHQALGFLIDELSAFLGRYQVPCLMFGQQNREGLDYEDERTIRGADKILDTVSSFSIFKWKDDESLEPGERPAAAEYTHKLIPRKVRWGAGLRDKNYINIRADYRYAWLEEGPTRDELFEQSGGRLKGVSHAPVIEPKKKSS